MMVRATPSSHDRNLARPQTHTRRRRRRRRRLTITFHPFAMSEVSPYPHTQLLSLSISLA
ncbi:hypothetical protein JHK82_031254 [Glycine max]|nr:hypothetical protein JHK85_031907 [Glycine max]KAG4994520.1 hypothetical protein JHK86_031347 [Glycine max]KAG5124517.1 hypothetical protein JHK82_031254 [Glycine max]KAG5145945.1 hypothetical protein JHK84_031488 [Glycine max]